MTETLKFFAFVLALGVSVVSSPAKAQFLDGMIGNQAGIDTIDSPPSLVTTTGPLVPATLTFDRISNLNYLQNTFKTVNESAMASANLSVAQLKSRASLSIGSNQTGSAREDLDSDRVKFSAYAAFSDNFIAYTNPIAKNLFSWNANHTATFSFAFTGSTVFSQFLHSLPPSDALFINAQLDLDVFSLNENLERSGLIFSQNIGLGPNLLNSSYQYSKVVNGTSDFPTVFSATFNPNGNFGWEISLGTELALPSSLQSVFANIDFANTVVVSYDGPAGSTTFSESGVFPGTLALASAVPESETWTLLLVGLGVIGMNVKRRS